MSNNISDTTGTVTSEWKYPVIKVQATQFNHIFITQLQL